MKSRPLKSIESLLNPIVKDIIKLKDTSSRKNGTSLVIGNNIVNEIITYKNNNVDNLIKRLFIINENDIPNNIKNNQIILNNTFILSEAVMAKICDVPNPPKIAAQLYHPSSFNHFNNKDSTYILPKFKWILALSSLNDPSNLGALLRSASALDWDAVFLIKHTENLTRLQSTCCDPFSLKAIAAARGCQYKLPIFEGSWDNLRSLKLPIVFADVKNDIKTEKLDSENGCVLVLGNESKGNIIGRKDGDHSITIPINSERMESLNVSVAGGILMHSLKNNLKL